METTLRADGLRTRILLDITTLAHKQGRGRIPQYHCSNCNCNRYTPCHCMLGEAARKTEWKRIKGIK